MAAESPKRMVKYNHTIIRPHAFSDKTVMESVVDFISDVVPQAYCGNQKVEDKEKIQWIRFENTDGNDLANNPDFSLAENKGIPLLLILGYSNGVQIWNITPSGEAQEALSLRQGPVKVLRILPTPTPVFGDYDPYSVKRPLLAVCDTSSAGQPYCSVKFVSLRTGDEVHNVSFKTLPVHSIECNKRVMVVVFQEKLCVFDACSLRQLFWVTSCFPSTGPNFNPVALGTRWLAYADKRLVPVHQSCGGMSGDGAQSYAATVISAAKGAFKGLTMFGEAIVSNVTGAKPGPPTKKVESVLDNGHRPGIVSIIDLQSVNGDHFCVSEENEGEGLIAHFHAHANEPVAAMSFDATGRLLLTACKLGHNFHVFRIMAHPCSSSLGAVHHLYTLHRGDTTAKVIDMSFSQDSRWVTVNTHRGTTHVFPITPYGGTVNLRTHCSPRVVNRASRYHKSAGLDESDYTTSARRSPVLSGSPGSSGQYDNYPSLIRHNAINNSMGNPRLPPFPHPTTVYPLAQIKQPLNLVTSIGGTKTQSPTHSATGTDNMISVASCFCTPRLWMGGSPNLSVDKREERRAVDSLFIMSPMGTLVEYILEPKPKIGGTEKINDESMLDLSVTGYTQWHLQRSKTSEEVKPPLANNNPLMLAADAVRTQQPTSLQDLGELAPVTRHDSKDSLSSDHSSKDTDFDEQWLSQVEIFTHVGPHRRLWMGPQFSFKTYQNVQNTTVLSSNSSALLSQSPEANLAAMDIVSDECDLESLKIQPARSSPVAMPNSRPAYRRQAGSDSTPPPGKGPHTPLLIEAGSFDQSPNLCDVYTSWAESTVAKQPRGSEEEEDRIKETLAEAMLESPLKEGGPSSIRNGSKVNSLKELRKSKIDRRSGKNEKKCSHPSSVNESCSSEVPKGSKKDCINEKGTSKIETLGPESSAGIDKCESQLSFNVVKDECKRKVSKKDDTDKCKTNKKSGKKGKHTVRKENESCKISEKQDIKVNTKDIEAVKQVVDLNKIDKETVSDIDIVSRNQKMSDEKQSKGDTQMFSCPDKVTLVSEGRTTGEEKKILTKEEIRLEKNHQTEHMEKSGILHSLEKCGEIVGSDSVVDPESIGKIEADSEVKSSRINSSSKRKGKQKSGQSKSQDRNNEKVQIDDTAKITGVDIHVSESIHKSCDGYQGDASQKQERHSVGTQDKQKSSQTNEEVKRDIKKDQVSKNVEKNNEHSTKTSSVVQKVNHKKRDEQNLLASVEKSCKSKEELSYASNEKNAVKESKISEKSVNYSQSEFEIETIKGQCSNNTKKVEQKEYTQRSSKQDKQNKDRIDKGKVEKNVTSRSVCLDKQIENLELRGDEDGERQKEKAAWGTVEKSRKKGKQKRLSPDKEKSVHMLKAENISKNDEYKREEKCSSKTVSSDKNGHKLTIEDRDQKNMDTVVIEDLHNLCTGISAVEIVRNEVVGGNDADNEKEEKGAWGCVGKSGKRIKNKSSRDEARTEKRDTKICSSLSVCTRVTECENVNNSCNTDRKNKTSDQKNYGNLIGIVQTSVQKGSGKWGIEQQAHAKDKQMITSLNKDEIKTGEETKEIASITGKMPNCPEIGSTDSIALDSENEKKHVKNAWGTVPKFHNNDFQMVTPLQMDETRISKETKDIAKSTLKLAKGAAEVSSVIVDQYNETVVQNTWETEQKSSEKKISSQNEIEERKEKRETDVSSSEFSNNEMEVPTYETNIWKNVQKMQKKSHKKLSGTDQTEELRDIENESVENETYEDVDTFISEHKNEITENKKYVKNAWESVKKSRKNDKQTKQTVETGKDKTEVDNTFRSSPVAFSEIKIKDSADMFKGRADLKSEDISDEQNEEPEGNAYQANLEVGSLQGIDACSNIEKLEVSNVKDFKQETQCCSPTHRLDLTNMSASKQEAGFCSGMIRLDDTKSSESKQITELCSGVEKTDKSDLSEPQIVHGNGSIERNRKKKNNKKRKK